MSPNFRLLYLGCRWGSTVFITLPGTVVPAFLFFFYASHRGWNQYTYLQKEGKNGFCIRFHGKPVVKEFPVFLFRKTVGFLNVHDASSCKLNSLLP